MAQWKMTVNMRVVKQTPTPPNRIKKIYVMNLTLTLDFILADFSFCVIFFRKATE